MSTELLNIDCMEYMAGLDDNAFDLAIVDPPYGIGDRLKSGGGFMKDSPQKTRYIKKQWDKETPSKEYFIELRRVSSSQMIWGGNYFDLPPTRCVISWVKPSMKNHPAFSQWEMCWTSFLSSAKVVYCNVANLEEKTTHPTQKPVKLYQWLLQNYAKPGQRILDTHLGSGSSAIAAHYFGCDFVGCELDKDYHDAACKRFKRETRQIAMF